MDTQPWLKSYPPGVRWNAPLELSSVQRVLETAAERFGPLPALEFMDKRISYAELDALANRAAAGFQKLGVRPGVHVGDLHAQHAPLRHRLLRRAESRRHGRQLFAPGRAAHAPIQDRRQRDRNPRHARPRGDLSAGGKAARFDAPENPDRRRVRRDGARPWSGQGANGGRRNAGGSCSATIAMWRSATSSTTTGAIRSIRSAN